MIALHDCNGDVNRAINVLLEGNPDTVSPCKGYFLGICTLDFYAGLLAKVLILQSESNEN